jgi:signal transduction histidine kinase
MIESYSEALRKAAIRLLAWPVAQHSHTNMPYAATDNRPDIDLIADIVTPLYIVTALLALLSLSIMLGTQQGQHLLSYLFPIALMLSAVVAHIVRVRGQLVLAGLVLAFAYGLLPVATLFTDGIENNYIAFISPLGVLIGMVVGSVRLGISITLAALGMILVAAVMNYLTVPLFLLGVLALVLVATAALSGAAADTIHGTIAWALDTLAKSERREGLLRDTQAELQQAIYERERLNVELMHSNHALEEARRAAEQAYRSKTTFMARMSHELRTPLNLIIGFSTAMLEHPQMYDEQMLPEVYREDMGAIRTSGKHLLGLINDILDLAKLEANKLDLYKVPLDMPMLLEEMHKTAGALLLDRPVRLRCEWSAALPVVLADVTRVRQVLLNLVSNACKFTDRGEIGLGARVHGEVLLVWVRDTGIGIPLDDQARIFGEFEQAESADGRRRGGTGLGLAVCRWLIELHGGKMWLKSVPGKGSTFLFTLPLVAVAEPALVRA